MSSDPASRPVYLRGIPSDVVREAKAVAARRGVTLAGFVAEALARAVDEKKSPDDQRHNLRKEQRWYERNRERLVREFEGEYVAIVEGQVVDHSERFEDLAERVFARLGARDVFMPRVSAAAGVVRVQSPRIRRAR